MSITPTLLPGQGSVPNDDKKWDISETITTTTLKTMTIGDLKRSVQNNLAGIDNLDSQITSLESQNIVLNDKIDNLESQLI